MVGHGVVLLLCMSELLCDFLTPCADPVCLPRQRMLVLKRAKKLVHINDSFALLRSRLKLFYLCELCTSKYLWYDSMSWMGKDILFSQNFCQKGE